MFGSKGSRNRGKESEGSGIMRKHRGWFYVGWIYITVFTLLVLYEQIFNCCQVWYATPTVFAFIAVPFLCGLKAK